MGKRKPLTVREALEVVREIETGRGGIGRLARETPAIADLSRQRVGADGVTLYRSLLLTGPLRNEGVVSTTTDPDVAAAIARNYPVILNRPETLDAQAAILRYDVEPHRILADVGMLAEMCREVLGDRRLAGSIRSRRSDDLVRVGDVLEHAEGEAEVVADVSGLEPRAITFERSIRGCDRLELFRRVAGGQVDPERPDQEHLRLMWSEEPERALRAACEEMSDFLSAPADEATFGLAP